MAVKGLPYPTTARVALKELTKNLGSTLIGTSTNKTAARSKTWDFPRYENPRPLLSSLVLTFEERPAPARSLNSCFSPKIVPLFHDRLIISIKIPSARNGIRADNPDPGNLNAVSQLGLPVCSGTAHSG